MDGKMVALALAGLGVGYVLTQKTEGIPTPSVGGSQTIIERVQEIVRVVPQQVASAQPNINFNPIIDLPAINLTQVTPPAASGDAGGIPGPEKITPDLPDLVEKVIGKIKGVTTSVPT